MTHQGALRPGLWLVDWSLNASQPDPKDLSNYVIFNFDFGWNMFQHQKGNNFKAGHVSLIKTHLIGISAQNQDCLYIFTPPLLTSSRSQFGSFSLSWCLTRCITHPDWLPDPLTPFDHQRRARVVKPFESVQQLHCSNRLLNIASEEQKSHGA